MATIFKIGDKFDYELIKVVRKEGDLTTELSSNFSIIAGLGVKATDGSILLNDGSILADGKITKVDGSTVDLKTAETTEAGIPAHSFEFNGATYGLGDDGKISKIEISEETKKITELSESKLTEYTDRRKLLENAEFDSSRNAIKKTEMIDDSIQTMYIPLNPNLIGWSIIPGIGIETPAPESLVLFSDGSILDKQFNKHISSTGVVSEVKHDENGNYIIELEKGDQDLIFTEDGELYTVEEIEDEADPTKKEKVKKEEIELEEITEAFAETIAQAIPSIFDDVEITDEPIDPSAIKDSFEFSTAFSSGEKVAKSTITVSNMTESELFSYSNGTRMYKDESGKYYFEFDPTRQISAFLTDENIAKFGLTKTDSGKIVMPVAKCVYTKTNGFRISGLDGKMTIDCNGVATVVTFGKGPVEASYVDQIKPDDEKGLDLTISRSFISALLSESDKDVIKFGKFTETKQIQELEGDEILNNIDTDLLLAFSCKSTDGEEEHHCVDGALEVLTSYYHDYDSGERNVPVFLVKINNKPFVYHQDKFIEIDNDAIKKVAYHHHSRGFIYGYLLPLKGHDDHKPLSIITKARRPADLKIPKGFFVKATRDEKILDTDTKIEFNAISVAPTVKHKVTAKSEVYAPKSTPIPLKTKKVEEPEKKEEKEEKEEKEPKPTDEATKDTTPPTKPSAPKKNEKKGTENWNIIANSLFYAMAISLIACMFLPFIAPVLQAVAVGLFAAGFVSKGIAWQGGFAPAATKEITEGVTSDGESKEAGKTKEYSKKFTKYASLDKELKSNREKYDALNQELTKYREKGLGSSREAQKLESDISKIEKTINEQEKSRDKLILGFDSSEMERLLGPKPKIDDIKIDTVRESFFTVDGENYLFDQITQSLLEEKTVDIPLENRNLDIDGPAMGETEELLSSISATCLDSLLPGERALLSDNFEEIEMTYGHGADAKFILDFFRHDALREKVLRKQALTSEEVAFKTTFESELKDALKTLGKPMYKQWGEYLRKQSVVMFDTFKEKYGITDKYAIASLPYDLARVHVLEEKTDKTADETAELNNLKEKLKPIKHAIGISYLNKEREKELTYARNSDEKDAINSRYDTKIDSKDYADEVEEGLTDIIKDITTANYTSEDRNPVTIKSNIIQTYLYKLDHKEFVEKEIVSVDDYLRRTIELELLHGISAEEVDELHLNHDTFSLHVEPSKVAKTMSVLLDNTDETTISDLNERYLKYTKSERASDITTIKTAISDINVHYGKSKDPEFVSKVFKLAAIEGKTEAELTNDEKTFKKDFIKELEEAEYDLGGITYDEWRKHIDEQTENLRTKVKDEYHVKDTDLVATLYKDIETVDRLDGKEGLSDDEKTQLKAAKKNIKSVQKQLGKGFLEEAYKAAKSKINNVSSSLWHNLMLRVKLKKILKKDKGLIKKGEFTSTLQRAKMSDLSTMIEFAKVSSTSPNPVSVKKNVLLSEISKINGTTYTSDDDTYTHSDDSTDITEDYSDELINRARDDVNNDRAAFANFLGGVVEKFTDFKNGISSSREKIKNKFISAAGFVKNKAIAIGSKLKLAGRSGINSLKTFASNAKVVAGQVWIKTKDISKAAAIKTKDLAVAGFSKAKTIGGKVKTGAISAATAIKNKSIVTGGKIKSGTIRAAGFVKNKAIAIGGKLKLAGRSGINALKTFASNAKVVAGQVWIKTKDISKAAAIKTKDLAVAGFNKAKIIGGKVKTGAISAATAIKNKSIVIGGKIKSGTIRAAGFVKNKAIAIGGKLKLAGRSGINSLKTFASNAKVVAGQVWIKTKDISKAAAIKTKDLAVAGFNKAKTIGGKVKTGAISAATAIKNKSIVIGGKIKSGSILFAGKVRNFAKAGVLKAKALGLKAKSLKRAAGLKANELYYKAMFFIDDVFYSFGEWKEARIDELGKHKIKNFNSNDNKFDPLSRAFGIDVQQYVADRKTIEELLKKERLTDTETRQLKKAQLRKDEAENTIGKIEFEKQKEKAIEDALEDARRRFGADYVELHKRSIIKDAEIDFKGRNKSDLFDSKQPIREAKIEELLEKIKLLEKSDEKETIDMKTAEMEAFVYIKDIEKKASDLFKKYFKKLSTTVGILDYLEDTVLPEIRKIDPEFKRENLNHIFEQWAKKNKKGISLGEVSSVYGEGISEEEIPKEFRSIVDVDTGSKYTKTDSDTKTDSGTKTEDTKKIPDDSGKKTPGSGAKKIKIKAT